MTTGFLCDGCDRFWPGRQIGAEIRFLCFHDDDGRPMPDVVSHVCPDCVVKLHAQFGPLHLRRGAAGDVNHHDDFQLEPGDSADE